MDDEQIPDWAKTWYYDKGFAEAEEFWRFEERERIIKLIESGVAACDGEGSHYYCTEICDIEKFIALINGENK